MYYVFDWRYESLNQNNSRKCIFSDPNYVSHVISDLYRICDVGLSGEINYDFLILHLLYLHNFSSPMWAENLNEMSKK